MNNGININSAVCQVTYITLSAVIPHLHMHVTVVASVHKVVTGLIVKFIEHRHGGILGPAERGELPVSLT